MAILLIGIVGTATIASAVIALISLIISIKERKGWFAAAAVVFLVVAVTVYFYGSPQEDKVSTETASEVPQQKPTTEKKEAIVSQYGLDISIVGCQQTTPGIECQLSVTSQEKAQKLTAYASYFTYRSEAYPGDGNDYVASHVKLGSAGDERSVTNRLMQGEPMNMVLRFADVPGDASKLTTLNVCLKTEKEGVLEDIVFRNIPIKK